MAQTVTDDQFQNEVLQSDVPVLVDFWAVWCGPCRTMEPIIEELADEYAGKVKVMKMNVDESPVTPGNYNIMSIPTFILYKGGQPVKIFVGTRSKEDMKAELDAVA